MEIVNATAHEYAQFELLINALLANKYAFCDDFFDKETLEGLRNNLLILNAAEGLKTAGIGNQDKLVENKTFRGDKIKWIDVESENVFEKTYNNKINKFITHLNSTCYTSLNHFESHYACYSPNTFYKRHLDQFKSDKGRKFSMVLFLNEDWKDEDGGKLSLYPEGGLQQDISPISGRMVFFRSDELEHEVQASLLRDRLSIAAWIKSV